MEVQNDTLIFDETTIEGFEAGLKGTFFEGRVRADLAAFWYEAKDLQVGIFNSNTTSHSPCKMRQWRTTGVSRPTPSPKPPRVCSCGCPASTTTWNTTNGRMPAAIRLTMQSLSPTNLTTGPGCHIGPDGAAIQDLSGVRYGNAPLQVNVGFTYDWMLANDWRLSFDWDTIHHSKGKRVLNQPFTEVPSRTVTHVGATLRQGGGNWEARLICSNCFNEVYVQSIGNRPLAKTIAGVNSDKTAQIAPPRLVTLQATYSF